METILIPMGRAAVYLFEAFALLVVAKWAYTGLYRRVDLKAEALGSLRFNGTMAQQRGSCDGLPKRSFVPGPPSGPSMRRYHAMLRHRGTHQA